MRCAAPLALSLSLTLTLLLDRSAAPAVEQLSLHGPGSQATVRERGVGPGATRSYEVEISPRDRARFLAAELWYTKPRDGPTPDPILMVAQGKAPQCWAAYTHWSAPSRTKLDPRLQCGRSTHRAPLKYVTWVHTTQASQTNWGRVARWS